jgi:hypothetical protein
MHGMTLKSEYLREFKVIFEMALGYESGHLAGSIHGQKPNVENLVRI